jgi:hypothetical protein
MNSSVETWICTHDGEVFLHVENDGPAVLRKGLQAREYPVRKVGEKYFYSGRPLPNHLVVEADAAFAKVAPAAIAVEKCMDEFYTEYETPAPPKVDDRMAHGWHKSKKKPANSCKYIRGVGVCTVFPYGNGFKVVADSQFYGPYPTQKEAQFAAEMLAPPKFTSEEAV